MEYPIVYVTADAVVSSLGFSTEASWKKMIDNQSGITKTHNPMLYFQPFLSAQISDVELQKQIEKYKLSDFTRLEQLFILVIQQTLNKCDIDVTSSDCGLIISSTKGNIVLLSVENEQGDELFLTTLSEKVASHFGFTSKPIVVCNACISGVSAMIVAKRLIENGTYKHVIVTGGDELSRFIVSGFHAFKSVSSEICKPYDATRDGLSLGEACGSMLLTSDRTKVSEIKPICLLGGAISNDANHISGPSRTGEELSMAMTSALNQADLQPKDISFVNAHGTATLYNDEMESKALHLADMDKIPMQSLKSFLGHTLGASGIVEAIFCKKQIEEDIVLGIPNFEKNGVPFPLNISAKHRQMELSHCMKTASGFGGSNAALILGKEPDCKKSFSQNNIKTKILLHSKIDKQGVQLDGEKIVPYEKADTFATFIRKTYSFLKLDYRKFYKMDDLSKLGFIATECLLNSSDDFANANPEKKGIIVANRSASLNTDINYCRNINTVGDYEASPAIFVYTLPNVMLGEVCIRWKIKGENTFFIQNKPNFDFLMNYAKIAMQEQNMKYCIIGWCDLLKEEFEANFWLVKRTNIN